MIEEITLDDVAETLRPQIEVTWSLRSKPSEAEIERAEALVKCLGEKQLGSLNYDCESFWVGAHYYHCFGRFEYEHPQGELETRIEAFNEEANSPANEARIPSLQYYGIYAELVESEDEQ